MSDEYANSPLTFGMPSGRRTDTPTPLRTSVIVLIATSPPPSSRAIASTSPVLNSPPATTTSPLTITVPPAGARRAPARRRGPRCPRGRGRRAATARGRRACRPRACRARPRARGSARRAASPSSSASCAVIAAGPPRRRAVSSAWRSSPPSSPASLDAAPSTPRPTGAPARTSGITGAIPAPSRAFEDGQCATPVRVSPKRAISRVGEVHAVREPDVVAEPAELLEVLDRPHAEPLEAERLLLDGLGHVRVQPNAALAGELRRLGHQLLGDAERRARRERDPAHRARRRVVELVQRRRVGGEDRVAVLDHAVGREPALQRRRGPSRRGTDGSGCRARAPPRSRPRSRSWPRGEHVVVVGGGRAARAQQRREPGPRRRAHAPARRSAPTPGTARRATRTASPAARARAWPTGRGGGGS